MKSRIEVGQVYGNLTVVKQTTSAKGTRWVCKCTCGNTCIARAQHLRSGATTSCGCKRRKVIEYVVPEMDGTIGQRIPAGQQVATPSAPVPQNEPGWDPRAQNAEEAAVYAEQVRQKREREQDLRNARPIVPILIREERTGWGASTIRRLMWHPALGQWWETA